MGRGWGWGVGASAIKILWSIELNDQLTIALDDLLISDECLKTVATFILDYLVSWYILILSYIIEFHLCYQLHSYNQSLKSPLIPHVAFYAVCPNFLKWSLAMSCTKMKDCWFSLTWKVPEERGGANGRPMAPTTHLPNNWNMILYINILSCQQLIYT